MIPQISQAPGVVQLVLNFLQVLEQQGFTGDTATSYADRLTMATDNSVYQLLIPEMSQGQHSNVGTVFFAVGFSVMMVLDVVLG